MVMFVPQRLEWIAGGLMLLSACGGSTPAAPTVPQTPTPSAGEPVAAPVARLALTIDGRDAQDIVVGLSEVAVDASASTGTGALSYTIDFGDGTTAATATARHTYAGPGTLTITATVRDAAGQSASASQMVVAKTLRGQWFHAAYIPRAGRAEVRRLEITDQEGATIRGFYTATGAPARSFTGRLTTPRRVEIAIAGENTQLEGTIPPSWNEAAGVWSLLAHGGVVDGQQLAFREIIGQPSAPPPDAVLRIRFDNFGSTVPIVGLSPIQFDASTSRGEGLTYVMEYGDGGISAEPTTTHRIDHFTPLARLTVVDRFGRADSKEQQFYPFALNSGTAPMWFTDSLNFRFHRRDGVTYQGGVFYRDPSLHEHSAPFVATLSGERDVRIVAPALGLEFRGYVDLSSSSYAFDMVLTQFGGADHGRIWTLFYDDGPG
jgi:PKD repeat protein